MIIGNFQQHAGRYTGEIRTLTFSAETTIEPVDKRGDKSPDYRVTSGDVELGAAWKRTSEEGGNEYLSIQLDDPALPFPIHCRLVKSGAELGHTLYWDRPRPRKSGK